MEGYNQMDENTSSRGSFLYGSPSNNNSSLYGRTSATTTTNNNNQAQMGNFHLLQSSNHCYQEGQQQQHQQQQQVNHPVIKTEVGASSQHGHKFHYPSIIRSLQSFQNHHHQQQQHNQNQQQEESGNCCEIENIKAKIISHPQYTYVLDAYMDCQKVGAPPEVVAKLTAIRKEFEAKQRASVAGRDAPKDPELDQFMESYYDMLIKYRDEITRTLQEAMDFTRKVEAQLNSLSIGPVKIFNPDEKWEGSSEEEQENSGGETELPEFNPRAEDRELKNHLLKKYSGYLSSLKQELSKKKKKGKLPKEARQKLLSWWELHYKWPYPSESEKVALAEATGLDQKQINNWFINQRKRHWKPSEDMQFMGLDSIHSQNAALYMEGHYIGDGSYRLCP